MIEILRPHTSSFAIVVCSYFGRRFEDAMYILDVENSVLLVKLVSLVMNFAHIVTLSQTNVSLK